MVIDQIDIRGIALLEPEDDPPVGPNGDCSNNPPTRLSAGAAESPVNRVAQGASLHRSESACARSCRRAAGSTRAGRRLRKDGVSRGVESDGSRQTPIVTIVTCQPGNGAVSRRATASSAPISPAPAPAASSSRRRAGSTPNCNAAPTSSWTPITSAISTMTGHRPRPSSQASSSGRPQGAGLRFRPAARLRRARRDLRARLRRARPPRRLGRHQPAQHRRQDPPDPGPLRPDRQPLRLVRLRAAPTASSNSGRSPPAARCIDIIA